MNKVIEAIIPLGKDSIVQIALDIIEKDIDIKNFSKIKVISNGESVYVLFLIPIKYLPINSVFYFDIVVEILEKTVTYTPLSNGVNENKKIIPFYKQTEPIKRNIQFVIDAINNSTEIDSIDTVSFEDNMEIREYKEYYSILIVSKNQESSYKIEKVSGKIYDTNHAHLEHTPTFEDEDILNFKEIK